MCAIQNDLKKLKIRLQSLTVFRELLCDPLIKSLCRFLDALECENISDSVSAYAEFVSFLYNADAVSLGEYIRGLCENSENIYMKLIGKGVTPPNFMKSCVENELQILQEVADLDSAELRGASRLDIFLPEFSSGGINIAESFAYRVKNIGKYGFGMYARNRMFYINEENRITPVKNPDATTLDSLVDYEYERGIILSNTKALLEGKPAANALLTGDAGTGKSSTVKAVVNELYSEGLRIIEVRKDQLYSLPLLLDELAENPLKFILFIDDLSFGKDDDNFNALKAVLEGSVSAKSKNVVIYATSNRRHIIKEKFSDREGDDIHKNDTMQELISLSERFGLHITFSKPDKKTYLHIVRHLAQECGLSVSSDELEAGAERFALERGGRSARLARQYVDMLKVSAD